MKEENRIFEKTAVYELVELVDKKLLVKHGEYKKRKFHFRQISDTMLTLSKFAWRLFGG